MSMISDYLQIKLWDVITHSYFELTRRWSQGTEENIPHKTINVITCYDKAVCQFSLSVGLINWATYAHRQVVTCVTKNVFTRLKHPGISHFM